MRFIDADRLIEILNRNFEGIGGAGVLAQLIESAPMVEAKSQIYGFWKGWTTSSCIGLDKFGEPKYTDKKFYRCSECKNGTIIKSNFCSKCGAKMGGGKCDCDGGSAR